MPGYGYNVRRAHMALWRDFNRTVGNGIVRPGIFIRRLQREGWIDTRESSADRRRQELTLFSEFLRRIQI